MPKIDRRNFLAIVPLLVSSTMALAKQSRVYVVNGEVDAKNYKGFEQFLFNSMDSVIGLKVNFLLNAAYQDGRMSANENNGQFVAYLAGPNSTSEVVATEGFQYLHGAYEFDGFFIVKSGGMHQGVISLYLQKTDEATIRLSSARLVDIQADRLDPRYKKKS